MSAWHGMFDRVPQITAQPISTAPERGRIMLYAGGRWFAECEWQVPGVISEHGFWLVWTADATDHFLEVVNPTLWAPLPLTGVAT